MVVLRLGKEKGNFLAFPRDKGVGKYLLSHKLSLIQLLIGYFRIMMKQKKLLHFGLNCELDDILPGTMTPSLFVFA